MVMNYKPFWTSILTLICIALVGCVPVAPPATYTGTERVDFNGLRFELLSARFANSYSNFANQPVIASDKFLIVEIAVTNLAQEPLPEHFKPVFSLYDLNGAKYEASLQHTMGINMMKSGRNAYGQGWNPNVQVKQEIVFEVPKQKYKLQVLVPYRAQMGFAGTTTVTGRYFFYDLSI
mgnify:CR=1 FL=1